MLMTDNTKETLKQVSYIYQSVLFNGIKVWILSNLDSEINAMTSTFIDKLGFFIQKVDFNTQKINGLILKIFGIVIVNLSLKNNIKEI